MDIFHCPLKQQYELIHCPLKYSYSLPTETAVLAKELKPQLHIITETLSGFVTTGSMHAMLAFTPLLS